MPTAPHKDEETAFSANDIGRVGFDGWHDSHPPSCADNQSRRALRGRSDVSQQSVKPSGACTANFDTAAHGSHSYGKRRVHEKAIQALPPAELAEFRRWFAEFDAEAWDRQIERDAAVGKLDKLAAEALADFQSGSGRPF